MSTSDLVTSLVRWAGDGRGLGLCTDLDGTLSPIVADPGAARPLPGTPEVLRQLGEDLDVVAVVSGRPVSYLLERLPDVGRARLVGLYGLERAVDGRVVESDEARAWRPAVAEVSAEAERWAPPGVLVERKGATVTLHWRSAPGRSADVVAWAAERAEATGLVPHGGKSSVELRPPGGGDKGDALDALVGGLAAVAFMGDDVGDLPAFAALARMRGRGVRTLAVAVGGAEAPAAVLAAADVVVDGPADVLAGLEGLRDALTRPTP